MHENPLHLPAARRSSALSNTVARDRRPGGP